MKVKSFILSFFLLLFPLLHLTAGYSLNSNIHARKEIQVKLNGRTRTRAPELIISGYWESNSLYLSFNQFFRKMKIRLIDINGKVIYDDFLTGNRLVTSFIDDFSTTLYIEIGSGEAKIAGEIDID